MVYKIAVASSAGENVDLSFGAAEEFYIYEVGENGEFSLNEIRKLEDTETDAPPTECGIEKTCLEQSESCHEATGNCSGGGNHGHGHIPKINLIKDCKCLLCKKIGYQAVKQFEKRGIAVFDIEYEINGALEKIISYYKRVR